MKVRLQLGQGPPIRKVKGKNKKAALVAAALLAPIALLAFALACWRLATDLSLAQGFAFSTGPLSHWQVWLALGISIQGCSFALNRYGNLPTEE